MVDGPRARVPAFVRAWRAGLRAFAACAILLLGALPAAAQDTTAPVLTGAMFHGRALTLTYNEQVDHESVPHTSRFSVSVNGVAQTPTYVRIWNPTGIDTGPTAVTLTLGTAAAGTDTVTVTYTVPASNPIQDYYGNDAAGLTNQAVTYIVTEKPRKPQVTVVAGDRSVTVHSELWDGRSAIRSSLWQVRAVNSFEAIYNYEAFNRASRIGGYGRRYRDTFHRLTNDKTYYVRVAAANDYTRTPFWITRTATWCP